MYLLDFTNQEIMQEMWNKRFSAKEYAYGTAPNAFFKSSIEGYQPTGKILLGAEGEGRNAVYAAQQGLEVTAFDISEAGKKKALQLAATHDVHLDYKLGDFLEMDFASDSFDVAALIFAHFAPDLLSVYHQKVASLIKPGGLLILQGYSKNNLPLKQKNPAIGGPNELDMLFSVEAIRNDFPNFEPLQLEEREEILKEGIYHNGLAKLICFVGRKSN